MSQITLSQAIQGCLFYKRAVGQSEHTIADYQVAYTKLTLHFKDDPPIASITRDHLINFFSWLRNEYISEPNGCVPRGKFKLSEKSIRNVQIAVSALWTWAVEEGVVEHHIARKIPLPAAHDTIIETLTQNDLQMLIKACDNSRAWKTNGAASNSRPSANRDKAIVMFLVDTGVRASELCSIKLSDINFQASSVNIKGKGGKWRTVYFGRRVARSLWKYLMPRITTNANQNDPVFLAERTNGIPEPMNRGSLLQLVQRLGKRAGVPNLHPHKFRHTFAITYLRNGGDLFTLQELLGHSDLKMVRRYAHIAQVDCANAHQKASPADNWKL